MASRRRRIALGSGTQPRMSTGCESVLADNQINETDGAYENAQNFICPWIRIIYNKGALSGSKTQITTHGRKKEPFYRIVAMILKVVVTDVISIKSDITIR
jgi:hypothetical protein